MQISSSLNTMEYLNTKQQTDERNGIKELAFSQFSPWPRSGFMS